ncbi:DMBT1 protein, partial [Nothoprocta pentlandii]|nr:DMBT1 protein [Nothoprocta pentlandii]
RCEGRLEVYSSSGQGTVCHNNWDLNDAQVVCRQLGCGYAIAAPGNASFGQGSGKIYLENVQCTGREASLFQCQSDGWGVHNCQHSEDAGVVCSEDFSGSFPAYFSDSVFVLNFLSPKGTSLRLVNGRHNCEGRIEIYYKGHWGTVCDDFWDLPDVQVVCRQLGCG